MEHFNKYQFTAGGRGNDRSHVSMVTTGTGIKKMYYGFEDKNVKDTSHYCVCSSHSDIHFCKSAIRGQCWNSPRIKQYYFICSDTL